MVDVRASNRKLQVRACNIIRQAVPRLTEERARLLLGQCNGSVKLAILVAETGVEVKAAKQMLVAVEGRLRAALIMAGFSEKGVDGDTNSRDPMSRDSPWILAVDAGGSTCDTALWRRGATTTHRSQSRGCNL